MAAEAYYEACNSINLSFTLLSQGSRSVYAAMELSRFHMFAYIWYLNTT